MANECEAVGQGVDVCTLQESLQKLGLKDYSEEDHLTGEGYPEWPWSGIWSSEGKLLYSIARNTKPEVIIEIGRGIGCSTSHLALACMHNKKGRVISIDVQDRGMAHIPAELHSLITIVEADALQYDIDALLADMGMTGKVGMLLEDGLHTYDFTKECLEKYVNYVQDGSYIVVHDVSSRDYAHLVRPAAESVLGNNPEGLFHMPPTGGGVGVWKRTTGKS